MIKGIGMDLVELERIQTAMKNERFIKRILTTEELDVFSKLNGKRKVEFLAGRFAAKEAYSKAVGSGICSSLSWQDISILNDPKGKPFLNVTSKGQDIVHITITHTHGMASAFVVIESLSG